MADMEVAWRAWCRVSCRADSWPREAQRERTVLESIVDRPAVGSTNTVDVGDIVDKR